MVVFIKYRDAHRQTAWRKKVFHADRLLRAKQRLEAVGQINRGDGIEITHAWLRPLPYPVQAAGTLILGSVAVFDDAIVKRLQNAFALDRPIAQAEIRHAKIIRPDQKYAVQIIRRRKIIPPVTQKPGHRLQRATPGVTHGAAVRIRPQGRKRRNLGADIAFTRAQQCAIRRVKPVFRNELQLFHHIGGTLDIALRLIEAQVKLLANFGLFFMQGADDIKHGK